MSILVFVLNFSTLKVNITPLYIIGKSEWQAGCALLTYACMFTNSLG